MLGGRQEHTMAIKASVEEGLEGWPEVLTRYYKQSAGGQATTKRVFVNQIKRFMSYLEEKGLDINDESVWATITEDEIIDWIESIRFRKNGSPLSSKTLSDYMVTLNNFFNWLARKRLVPFNPCPTREEMKAVIPEEIIDHKPVAMTPEEVERVAESILKTSDFPDRDICIFRLGCRTGLRAQALSEIDMSDVDFDNKEVVVIEKGNRMRHVKLGDDTLMLIRHCMSERRRAFGFPETDALFVKEGRSGNVVRISKKHIEKLLEENTGMLNKHITPHKMRSTCITITYAETGDIFQSARAAGHSNLRNTMLYINTDRQDAEHANRMDQIL